MAIEFKFDKHGGFWAVDRAAHIAEYAYQTSTFASEAKRHPNRIAAEMVESVQELTCHIRSQAWYLESRSVRISQFDAI